MSRIAKIIVAINLLALTALVFVYPELMVGPGKLIPGHKALEGDCFACHTPLLGAASERCTSCHKPEAIGRLTTTGQHIAKPLTATPFHQELKRQDCVACHSDHAGVKRFRSPGRFNHALLKTETRAQCQNCHQSPADDLHRQITGNCSQCHDSQKWTPAKFDHNKFFVLDREHNSRCVTCHVRNDYSRYTCFGCHEHTPENIRRKHLKEGIRSFDNCVECHRSADEHDIRGAEGRGKGKHGRKKHDDD